MNPPPDCTACPLGLIKGNRVVPGEGSLAENSVLIVGIAPGAKENQEGKPFVGPSGEVLRRNLSIFEEAGLEARITNLVKHRPPNNRNPKPNERAACLPYLQAELAEWRGRVILCLGEPAIRFWAPTVRTLAPVLGQPIPLTGGRVMVPSYHPAMVVRGLIDEEEIRKAIRLAADVATGKVAVEQMQMNYKVWDGENLWAENPDIDYDEEPAMGLDTESEGWEPFGLSVSLADGTGYWVPRDEVRRFWRRGLQEQWPDRVVMHFAAHDLAVLDQMGLPWPDRVEDTQVLAHLRGYDIGLKALVLALFGYVMTPFDEMVKAVGGKLRDVPLETLVPYAVMDADMTRRAYFKLRF